MCKFQGTYGAERCALKALQHLILHHSQNVQSPQSIPLPTGVTREDAHRRAVRQMERLRALRTELEDLFGQQT